VLAEQHDEWAEQRRYLGLEVLTKARDVLAERQNHPEEVTADPIADALTA
jgi:putative transposase